MCHRADRLTRFGLLPLLSSLRCWTAAAAELCVHREGERRDWWPDCWIVHSWLPPVCWDHWANQLVCRARHCCLCHRLLPLLYRPTTTAATAAAVVAAVSGVECERWRRPSPVTSSSCLNHKHTDSQTLCEWVSEWVSSVLLYPKLVTGVGVGRRQDRNLLQWTANAKRARSLMWSSWIADVVVFVVVVGECGAEAADRPQVFCATFFLLELPNGGRLLQLNRTPSECVCWETVCRCPSPEVHFSSQSGGCCHWSMTCGHCFAKNIGLRLRLLEGRVSDSSGRRRTAFLQWWRRLFSDAGAWLETDAAGSTSCETNKIQVQSRFNASRSRQSTERGREEKTSVCSLHTVSLRIWKLRIGSVYSPCGGHWRIN